jgi:hypothetical protein
MNAHLSFRFLLPLLLALLAAPLAAQHFYYAPNAAHIPTLAYRNDASLTLGVGRGSGFRALEAQMAYSPMNHVGIMFNYFGAGDKGVERQEEIGGLQRFAEGGVGAYQHAEKGTASLFVGYGQGFVHNYYGQERYSRFQVTRVFVQPSLMYHDKYFRGGLALRFNRLVYTEGETAFNIEEQELQAIRTIEERSPFFLPEMGIQVGMELSPFSLNLSLTNIFPKTYNMNFARFNSNFSLTFNLGKVMRKQKK